MPYVAAIEGTVVASFVCAVALLTGCGGGQAPDDIARGINQAVRAAKPKPGLELPRRETAPGRPVPGIQAVPEDQTESAAKRAVCDALVAYSADPATSLSAYISDYAERQRVLADYSLNEIDPDEADRLANAASDIENSQEAAEVASELGCA